MTDYKDINNKNEEENFDEINDKNLKEVEVIDTYAEPKNVSNFVTINLDGISRGIDIIEKYSTEDLKKLLKNSENLQNNNFKLFENIIEKIEHISEEKIKLILEYMDKNIKEEHEHARKVQQENNKHDEAMADKLLIAGISAAIFFGGILLYNADNNDSNKLE